MKKITIKHVRKILILIANECGEYRKYTHTLEHGKTTGPLTDYERGRIAGMFKAINHFSRFVNDLIGTIDADLQGVDYTIRDSNENEETDFNRNGPKYKVGQHVCLVRSVIDTEPRNEHVKCDLCHSTGKVRIVNGGDQEYTCPKCHGEIIKNEGEKYKFVIAYQDATIGRIEWIEWSDKYKGKGKKFDTVAEYLVEETGVEHGGAIWYEQQVFPSVKEAQEFCDTYLPTSRRSDCDIILKPVNNVHID